MKRIKKTLSIFLALTMLLMTFSVPVFAEDTLGVEITSNQTVIKTGNEQEITISVILNNPDPTTNDISGMNFDLKSNSEKIVIAEEATTLTTAFGEGGSTYNYMTDNGKYGKFAAFYMVGMTQKPITETKPTLMTIKFTVASDTPVGEYKIYTEGIAVTNTNAGSVYSENVECVIRVVEEVTGQQTVPITKPEVGQTPQSQITIEETNDTPEMTGTITWSPSDATFQKDVAYTASVELSLPDGYLFADGATASVAGAESVTNTRVENGVLKFDAKFAAVTLPAYSGTEAGTPELGTKAGGSVTLNTVTPPDGEAVEYGYSATNDAATITNWQDGTSFTNVPVGTNYFFARVKENNLHLAGETSNALEVTIFAKPVISGYSGALDNLKIGQEITAITPNATVGAGAAGSNPYAMTGDLPAGLSFNQTNGEISGTPTTYSANGGSVTITVTDREGISSEEYTLNFSAVAKKDNTLTVAQNDVTYGTAVLPAIENDAGTTTTTYQKSGETTWSSEVPKDVGSYTVKVTDAGNETTASGEAEDTFTISPKPITVNVTEATRDYGEENPTFNGTVDGSTPLAYDDELSDLGMSYSTTATKTSAVGTYDVTGTGTNSNYTIAVNGTDKLTVNPADYTYSVAGTQNIKIGSGLNAITVAPATGVGVDGEEVTGTLQWFSDSSRSVPAQHTDISSITTTGQSITLYWKFTATDTNYTDTPEVGQTVFTIVEGDPQNLTFATPQRVEKIYGDAAFTNAAQNDRTDGGTITYESSATDVATVNETTGEVTILKQGRTTITARAAAIPGTYAAGSAQYVLEVSPKEISATIGTYKIAKEYDGTTSEGTGSGDFSVSGILQSDTGVTVIPGNLPTYTAADAGSYTLTLPIVISGDTNGNYTLASDSLSVPATITAKPVTINTVTAEDKTFDGKNNVEITAVTFNESSPVPTLGSDFTATGTLTDVNVGTGKEVNVTVTLTNNNYTLADNTATTTIDVSKAGALTFEDLSVVHKKDLTGAQEKALPSLMPANAGTVSFAKGTESGTTSIISDWSVDASTGAVSYTLAGGNANDTVTLPITITSTNYEDSTVNLVISLTDLEIPTVQANDITVTYNGSPVEASKITGTAEFDGSAIDGAWSFKGSQGLTNVADSGTKVVVFTPTATTSYAAIEDTITLTINKATPSGTPTYTTISSSGKTLADAGLAIGSITPAGGTISWNLADTTTVEANKEYAWTYQPADSDNYNALTGKVVLWKQSTGSNGGSSGNSSSTTEPEGEVVENPDGSTTTTVTQEDGTVITTVEDKEGNVVETVENPDGTSVVTVENTDGSGSVTNVSADGTTETEVTLSEEAVEAAKEDGSALELPMPSVDAAENTDEAPVVKIDVPSNEETTVEIPVNNASESTVAVVVNPDGTEEIVMLSVPTENGVAMNVQGDTTVKIVNNEVNFIDMIDHWAENPVNYTAARRIFYGTGDNRFEPDLDTTRGTLMTILARLDGHDTLGGSPWYAKGMEWARANGVSDGTNPENPITREQLASMLYRYAGSPATDSSSYERFNDHGEISDYAKVAMAWCIDQGILYGDDYRELNPQDPASRCQVAAFVERYIKNILM